MCVHVCVREKYISVAEKKKKERIIRASKLLRNDNNKSHHTPTTTATIDDTTTTQTTETTNIGYEYATEKRLKWVSSKCTHYYTQTHTHTHTDARCLHACMHVCMCRCGVVAFMRHIIVINERRYIATASSSSSLSYNCRLLAFFPLEIECGGYFFAISFIPSVLLFHSKTHTCLYTHSIELCSGRFDRMCISLFRDLPMLYDWIQPLCLQSLQSA